MTMADGFEPQPLLLVFHQGFKAGRSHPYVLVPVDWQVRVLGLLTIKESHIILSTSPFSELSMMLKAQQTVTAYP